ncbi:MAG TPA: hypothetical protein VI072_18690 [Polyangiaceae bacterium]
MKPAHGGRIVLRMTSSGPPVEYALELHTSSGTHRGRARVDGDGKVDLATLSDGDAPAWLLKDAHALLRGLFRAHAVTGWPRRLTRWRAEPRAGT